VICTSVRHLANARTIEQPTAQNSGDIQEMETLKLNFAQIVENRETAGLTEQQAEQIAELCTEADKLLSKDRYTLQVQST